MSHIHVRENNFVGKLIPELVIGELSWKIILMYFSTMDCVESVWYFTACSLEQYNVKNWMLAGFGNW